MATANKLWTDVSGWTVTTGANSTETTNAATWAGNTAAQFTTSGKNHSNVNFIEISGTWESIFGIAPGSLVTLVGTPDDFDWQCTTATTIASSTAGPLELRDSGGALLLTLSTGATYSATTSRATQGGTQQTVPVAQIPSATTIRFRLGSTMATGNSSSASNVLLLGHVNVTITYTPLQWWEEGQTDAAALFVARRVRVWNAPSQRLNLGDPTTAFAAGDVVPLTWSWPYEQVSTIPMPLSRRRKVPDQGTEVDALPSPPPATPSGAPLLQDVVPFPPMKRRTLPTSGVAGSVVPLTWSWPYEQVSTTPPPMSRRMKVPDQGIEVVAPPVASPAVPNFPLSQDVPPRPPMKRLEVPVIGLELSSTALPWGWEDEGYEITMRVRVVKRVPDQGIEAQPIVVWPPHLAYDAETLPSLLRPVGRRTKVPDQSLEVQAVLVWPAQIEYDPPVRGLPKRRPASHDQGPEVWIEAPPPWAWTDTPMMLQRPRGRRSVEAGIEAMASAPPSAALLYYDVVSETLPIRARVPRRPLTTDGAAGNVVPIPYTDWVNDVRRRLPTVRTLDRELGTEVMVPPVPLPVPLLYYDFLSTVVPTRKQVIKRHEPIAGASSNPLPIQWGWDEPKLPKRLPHPMPIGQMIFAGGGSAPVIIPWQMEPLENHPRMASPRKWGAPELGVEVLKPPPILTAPLLYYDFVSPTLTARRFIRQVDDATYQEAQYLPFPYVVLSPELLLLVGVGP